MDSLSHDDVIEIIKIIDESKFDELHLETGDFKLIIARGKQGSALLRESTIKQKPTTKINTPEKTIDSGEQTSSSTVQKKTDVETKEGLIPIPAPLLGTFYRAPNPGAPPFVEIGQVVSKEDPIGIIEVMKLFRTVQAGVNGRIAEICVEDGSMVEYKQTIFLVEPESSS